MLRVLARLRSALQSLLHSEFPARYETGARVYVEDEASYGVVLDDDGLWVRVELDHARGLVEPSYGTVWPAAVWRAQTA